MQFSQEEEQNILLFRDETVKQKIRQGRIFEALDCISQNINLRSNLYGADSQEVQQYTAYILQQIMKQAQKCFYGGEPAKSVKLLKSLDKISMKNPQKAEVYHQLAFVYQKMGSPTKALEVIKKSLEIQEDPIEMAQTHLNICSLLTQMDRHKDALNHAMDSIILTQKAIEGLQNSQFQEEQMKQYLCVSAIAYHNVAIEYEILGQIERALEYYQKANLLVESYMPYHSLSSQIKTNYMIAKQKVMDQSSRLEAKKSKRAQSARSMKAMLVNENANKHIKQQKNFASYLAGANTQMKKKQHSNQLSSDSEERLPKLPDRKPIDFLQMNKASKIDGYASENFQEKLEEDDFQQLQELGLLDWDVEQPKRLIKKQKNP